MATIKSYRGAQLFEAMGLDQKVVDKYFTWTTTQVSGMSIEGIARESLERHARAFLRLRTTA